MTDINALWQQIRALHSKVENLEAALKASSPAAAAKLRPFGKSPTQEAGPTDQAAIHRQMILDSVRESGGKIPKVFQGRGDEE